MKTAYTPYTLYSLFYFSFSLGLGILVYYKPMVALTMKKETSIVNDACLL